MNNSKKTNITGKTISWQAPDFIYYRKSRTWYIIISIIAVVLAIVFYFLKLYAGIAVVFAGILALFSLSKNKPTMIKYILSDKGISYKDKIYKFEDLKSFCLTMELGIPKLFLEQTGKLKPNLEIILGKVNPQVVRNFLLAKLPENLELKQTFHETISAIIGF